MNFADRVLVRLAVPAERATLFDEAALGNIVAAGYDTEQTPVDAPFDAVFDELTLGTSVPPRTNLTGEWMSHGGTERTEARLVLHGLSDAPRPAIDALWRGGIVVRTLRAIDRIEGLDLSTSDFDVDPALIATLGALPADPAILEAERRNEVIRRITSGMQQPKAFGEIQLDRILTAAGVSSVGELTSQTRRQTASTSLTVRFSPPAAGVQSPRVLPVVAAILIRDAGFSISGLLGESKSVRAQLVEQGLERAADTDLRRRHTVLVVWMVPAALFDDVDWPGAQDGMTPTQQRASRVATAGAWLRSEGIGLVPVTD